MNVDLNKFEREKSQLPAMDKVTQEEPCVMRYKLQWPGEIETHDTFNASIYRKTQGC